jgi:chromosome segregation protein
LEERHRGERSAMARLEQQFQRNLGPPRRHRAGDRAAGRPSAPACWPTTSSSTAVGAELAGEIVPWKRVNEMALEDADMREALREGEEDLKPCAPAARRATESGADRSRSGAQAGRAEVPRRDQPQGAQLPGGGAGRARRSPPRRRGHRLRPSRSANDVRNRIESLGPVNAAAMEEFQEAQQRHDFLSAQRQDLIDSIRDTEKAIQDIDQVSRQKFAEAFEAINANFRECFQTLFGGGTGEMRLTDQENLAESGIDIVCSPPGKRLQNVLLLSAAKKPWPRSPC